MICPNCGKEILDGHMYCESCGCEINLVPEFDAEVEEHMAEGIQSVVEKANDMAGKPPVPEKKKKKKGNVLFYVSGALVAVFLFLAAALVFGGYTIYEHSAFWQEMMVEYHLDDGDYESAISYLEHIVQGKTEKPSLRFKLCELYMLTEQPEKALEMYKMIVGSNQFEFETKLAAAEAIVAYYVEQGDYQSIAEYLNTVQNKDIQLVFLQYMTSPVEFSQAEGTYSSLITLKLSSKGIGEIYYTTDGTIPDQNSDVFQNTIFLEAGENQISAVFINEYGVSSGVATKKYFIESKQVSPPEVVTYSGAYNCPVKIEIIRNSSAKIYYTTDGTSPNQNSLLYTGDIYVPIGKSEYKFIAVDESGQVSEVVTRSYQVTLETEMTTDDGKKLVQNYVLEQGAALDESGRIVMDEDHILIYEYLYPMSIEVGKDCYYYAEVARHKETNEQYRTGTYYGVDIRTEEVYKISR